MPRPSAVPVVLSEDERAELVRRAAGPGRWRADRARIVLACAEGMSNAGAAQALGVAVKSVSKWRHQFAAQRLAGLEDAAPVGRPKAELVLTDAERAQLARWARRAKTAQFLAPTGQPPPPRQRPPGLPPGPVAAGVGTDQRGTGRLLRDQPRGRRCRPAGRVRHVAVLAVGKKR